MRNFGINLQNFNCIAFNYLGKNHKRQIFFPPAIQNFCRQVTNQMIIFSARVFYTMSIDQM
jgi:hypothetical protein